MVMLMGNLDVNVNPVGVITLKAPQEASHLISNDELFSSTLKAWGSEGSQTPRATH